MKPATMCTAKSLTVVLALALAAAAPATAQDPGPSVRRGGALVTAHCAMCHAVGRQDESMEGAAPPLRIIARRVPLDRLEAQLREGLLGGHPAMPTFTFDARDAEAIVRYLRTIQE